MLDVGIRAGRQYTLSVSATSGKGVEEWKGGPEDGKDGRMED
jgi:hypothetical protein